MTAHHGTRSRTKTLDVDVAHADGAGVPIDVSTEVVPTKDVPIKGAPGAFARPIEQGEVRDRAGRSGSRAMGQSVHARRSAGLPAAAIMPAGAMCAAWHGMATGSLPPRFQR